ncbi:MULTISPECIES: hypothetical protein [Campylobacter]|uniref:hypothetical protein n=1 Tax=Campylobacter TaxID=194 RepID=UPI0015D7B241|nr:MULTISPECIES: hypothetical protein [unclassified Campylobacter]MCR8679671.1 hypothetical protein [Campylobacter sp. RM19072]MEE3777403.1 hypothetical protein [Campylobacter sp. CX2-4080-23]
MFFSRCATLTEAYSNTVNSINEAAREANVKNQQNTNNKYEVLSEDGDTRFGTVY